MKITNVVRESLSLGLNPVSSEYDEVHTKQTAEARRNDVGSSVALPSIAHGRWVPFT